MSLVRILAYTAVPAGIGAVASGFNDMSAVEGARQALLACLPMAILPSSGRQELDKAIEKIREHPFVATALCTGMGAAGYFLGSLGMKYLTGQNLDHGFATVVGALDGLLTVPFVSAFAPRGNKDISYGSH